MPYKNEALWVVIHIAHGKQRAENAETLLSEEGFLVRLRQLEHVLSESDATYEVLVLKSEAKEARNLLVEQDY